jgi:hypothetical protein
VAHCSRTQEIQAGFGLGQISLLEKCEMYIILLQMILFPSMR